MNFLFVSLRTASYRSRREERSTEMQQHLCDWRNKNRRSVAGKISTFILIDEFEVAILCVLLRLYQNVFNFILSPHKLE